MPRGQTSRLIAIIDDNESMQESEGDLNESGGGPMLRISKGLPRIRFALQAACLMVESACRGCPVWSCRPSGKKSNATFPSSLLLLMVTLECVFKP
jgi:hypothetical protein